MTSERTDTHVQKAHGKLHVHWIVWFPTLQRSLDRLSALYLVIHASLLQLLDNLCMALNVLRKWLAQLHMDSPSIAHPQVLLTFAFFVVFLFY